MSHSLSSVIDYHVRFDSHMVVYSRTADCENYPGELVREGILSKTSLSPAFKETMQRVEARFQVAKTGGELAGKDEAQIQAFYYKIVIEEMKSLRAKLEAERPDKSAADKISESAYRPAEGSADGRAGVCLEGVIT